MLTLLSVVFALCAVGMPLLVQPSLP